MKIQCPFCGNYFDDVNAVCPHCSAPNSGVVRTASSQPVTIEQLKDWYASKGLPPYETTRFFIGEDYRAPRAFGIYRDEQTGNFVVYKNKDNGERAVRYEGTDEAYAVNELFQRLKQEIIQQKGAKVKADRSAPTRSAPVTPSGKKRRGCCFLALVLPAIFMALLFVGTAIWVLIENAPEAGYYRYEGAPYYFYVNEEDSFDHDWYACEAGRWADEPLTKEETPQQLRKNRNAKKYFVQAEWSESLGVSDFMDSPAYYARKLAYEDKQNHYEVSAGYYQVDDYTYYHLGHAYDEGWYYYDSDLDDWSSIDAGSIPGELTHESLAQDFYYTPDWNSETQITDFTDSVRYAEDAPSYSSSSSSSSSSSWDNDDDDDYSWDSSDSWDSGSSDWDSDW